MTNRKKQNSRSQAGIILIAAVLAFVPFVQGCSEVNRFPARTPLNAQSSNIEQTDAVHPPGTPTLAQ